MFSRATALLLFSSALVSVDAATCLPPPAVVVGETTVSCDYNQACPYQSTDIIWQENSLNLNDPSWPCETTGHTFQCVCPDSTFVCKCRIDQFAGADEGDLEDVDVGEAES